MHKSAIYFAATAMAVGLSMSPGIARAADIMDTAISAGGFKTLVTAVEKAGLVETLKGSGPFTLFAPTDAAFAALPKATLASLLKPENKAKLVAILTYHVIPGRVLSKDIAGKTLHPKTVEGETLTINATGPHVEVNGATVINADIVADNGVIHVIDKVLMPE